MFIAGQSFLGLVMYTFYADCDPMQSGQLSQISQLVPQFVRDIVGQIGGMRGLFVSSLICASLRYPRDGFEFDHCLETLFVLQYAVIVHGGLLGRNL